LVTKIYFSKEREKEREREREREIARERNQILFSFISEKLKSGISLVSKKIQIADKSLFIYYRLLY